MAQKTHRRSYKCQYCGSIQAGSLDEKRGLSERLATIMDYDLHKLGWHSFQQLCITIAKEILGQTVEPFLDSGDGGRDGAFSGKWAPNGKEALSGIFVIQCKFKSKRDENLKASDISEEIDKAKKLVEKELCDSYILMTNAGVSGQTAASITRSLKNVGVKHVAVFGGTWVCQQITESCRLRMLVPRVYGLGDLSQILDERAYKQAHAILESLREDLAKVVITDAYKKSAVALDRHSFVLLIGEPAAGKTTVASMLAMSALDKWHAPMIKLYKPEQIGEHWNPNEPSQFFWVDDAFGITQYEAAHTYQWNHLLPQLNAMIRKGCKIVMTSRDYIYNSARKDLKESAFPLLNESQVVIDVHNLSLIEKRQILYNHIKLGKQPKSFRSEIKPYLENIANSSGFIPEIARRLSDPLFTKDLDIHLLTLTEFVENKERFLRDVIVGLDNNSKAALALIYMYGDRLGSPVKLNSTELEMLSRLKSDVGGCIEALKSLDGSLVQHVHANDEAYWRFKHPIIGDAYAEILAENPEMLSIYIHGSSPRKIISQVTCGDVGYKNAVIMPKTLFTTMIAKLDSFIQRESHKSDGISFWRAERNLMDFLSRRCSKEFISQYLEQHRDIVDRAAKPGLMLSAVSEVPLAARLYEFGLFPEDKREKFIQTVTNYALNGDDMAALGDTDIRKLFKDSEFEAFRERVLKEVVPRLANIRYKWEEEFDSGSPEDHMQPLIDSFGTLKECFIDDEIAVESIEQEIDNANDWISDKTEEESEIEPREIGTVDSMDVTEGVRSVFEDIDTDD